MRSRSSAPTGELPEALNEWADWIYQQAKLAARTCITAPPGEDPKDWRLHMSQRERRVMEACERAGIWRPR